MTNIVWEIYSACGIWYFALLILSFLAVLGYIIKVHLWPKSQPYWGVLLMSLIPLAIGLYATFDGYSFMLRAAREVQISSEEMEAGYATARVTSYFGAILSTPLVLLATALAAMKRTRNPVPETSERPSPDGR
ncbi:MAG: hypothetical protein ACK56Q_01300 [Pirellulaceae bacterium]|jgi:hypothetical protein